MGLKLATAMKEAWQDVEVKMKYFMDPVLMGKRKRTDDEASYDNRKAKKEARTQNFHSEIKGTGKTKSKKGKGKGKSKGKTTACKSTTQIAIQPATPSTTVSNGAMGATGRTCAGGPLGGGTGKKGSFDFGVALPPAGHADGQAWQERWVQNSVHT